MSTPALARSPGCGSPLALARRRRRRTTGVVLGGLLATLVGVLAVRVLLGDYTVTPVDLVRILRGEMIPVATFVVMESKLPRAVTALLGGMCLGAAGALLQDHVRNPVASPDVLGVTSGAGLGAVVGAVVLDLRGPAVTGCALAGAVVATALVVGLAGRGPRASTRLIVGGVATAAACHALVQWVLLRSSITGAHEALLWVTGSLGAATWDGIRWLALTTLALLPLAVVVGRVSEVTALGDDLAAGLGVDLRRTRAAVLVLVVLLVATVCALTGPIAFVALLSGPIARRLLRGRPTVVAAALVGAITLVTADHVAAYALPGTNLPVGVVTGAIGAPFLIWLITRRPTEVR